VISGAGPAGSTCAAVLAKNGCKVALIERDTTWRKPCGGAASSKVLEYYPQLRKLKLRPINGITMYSGDYRKLSYSWKDIKEPALCIDRLEFDDFIRNIAIDAGAELFDKNLSFDFISKNNNKIGIKTKAPDGVKEYFGRIVIIADGMSSKLALKSGLREKWKINEIGLCKCSIMEGSNLLDKESISLFFRKYKGYGWIFPLDETRFNIGCGTWLDANLTYNLNTVYNEFINDPFLKSLFPKKGYKEIWKGSYPLPALGVREKSLFKDNLMIIGDAAGYVSPINGEGIHASIVSGKVAGETAIDALERDDISNRTLKQYKTHPSIKKIIRNFKMKASMVEFFYENEGLNLSNMFHLAETDDQIREMVISLFLFSQPPTQDFLSRLKSMR
jgi:digeranylgeranylglycerophospholipid reductase